MLRTLFKITVLSAIFFSLLAQGADEPSGSPEKITVDAKVTFHNMGHGDEQVELPTALAHMFIDMLAKPSYKSHISKMPAAPLGIFKVADKIFLWHGNAVITGDGDNERLWSGALTQRMVRDGGQVISAKQDDLKKYFEKLAADPDLAKTKLEGPGAYPGGGDALHPAGLNTFKPEKDKPSSEK